jgi:hypothetical protein
MRHLVANLTVSVVDAIRVLGAADKVGPCFRVPDNGYRWADERAAATHDVTDLLAQILGFGVREAQWLFAQLAKDVVRERQTEAEGHQ